MVERAAEVHGAIAAAIGVFSNGNTREVDVRTLAKAGHIVELECEFFTRAALEKQGQKVDGGIETLGMYCW